MNEILSALDGIGLLLLASLIVQSAHLVYAVIWKI